MKKKHLFRFLSLLCVCVMVVGMLAGCGTDDTSDGSAAASTTSEQPAASEAPVTTGEAPAPAETDSTAESQGSTAESTEATASIFPLDETATLTMFYPWSPRFVQLGYESPNDFTFYSTLESMTNVHIDFTATGADVVQEKFQLMMATQDYTDMFFNCLDYYAGGIAKAIEDEAFIDLSQYEDIMPNYVKLMNDDPEFKKANYTDSGQLGQFLSYGKNVTLTQGYAIRQDWLDALNLEKPETYDQWFDVLSAFKNEYGLDNAMMEITPTSGFYCADEGNGYYVDNGEVHYFWTDAELAKEYLELAKKWYDAGLFTSSALVTNGITDAEQRQMKIDGSSGIFKVDIDDVGFYNSGEMGTEEGYHIVGLANPVKNSGDQPYGIIKQDSFSNGMTVSSACSDVELCVQWLDNFYTDDVILLANYGIEGDTFTYDEEGTPHFTDKVLNDPDGLNMALFKYVMDWGPCVLDWSRKFDAYDEVQQECLEIWTDRNIDGIYPTFAAYTTEESATVAEYWTDIDTYVDENIPKFVMGDMSLDDYDAFVETLNEMGVPSILECRQAAYERYNERG